MTGLGISEREILKAIKNVDIVNAKIADIENRMALLESKQSSQSPIKKPTIKK